MMLLNGLRTRVSFQGFTLYSWNCRFIDLANLSSYFQLTFCWICTFFWYYCLLSFAVAITLISQHITDILSGNGHRCKKRRRSSTLIDESESDQIPSDHHYPYQVSTCKNVTEIHWLFIITEFLFTKSQQSILLFSTAKHWY